jgi:phenylacetate-CoA ligase
MKLLYDLIPDSLKYGDAYRQALALFQQSDWWDKEALEKYQESLLKRLITHCYENVPYYRTLFKIVGITPADINTLDDLKYLPFLTKETVRSRKTDFMASNVSAWNVVQEATGGSTGSPLVFCMDMRSKAMERALHMRHLLWLGYEKGDVIAEVKSENFEYPKKIYKYSPTLKHIKFGPFVLDDDKLEEIVRTLKRFRPAFLEAYPSLLYLISKWLERKKETLPPMKYVITSSEMLYPAIREHAEKTFKCPVIDHYGQNELVAHAWQCAEAKGYHIQMESNVVELLPTHEGNYEIVGTFLHNFAMPLVRYKTGDLAFGPGEPCTCGRKHPVISGIIGRHGDIVVTPDGGLVSVAAMSYPFRCFEEIKEAQIIQEDIRTLIVKVVAWEHFTPALREKLIESIMAYLRSPGMRIIVEEAKEIYSTARGKRPFVLSHIDTDKYLEDIPHAVKTRICDRSPLFETRRFPRRCPVFDLYVCDITDEERMYRIKDLARSGVQVLGIRTRPGERRTFVIKMNGALQKSIISFHAECRWIAPATNGTESTAGFEVTDISAEDSTELRQFLGSHIFNGTTIASKEN